MNNYLTELDKEIEGHIQDMQELKRRRADREDLAQKQGLINGLKRARGIYKLTTQTQEYATKCNG